MQGISPLLSIIILNYRDARLTVKCVHRTVSSVRDAGIPSDIIVVDNSATETGETLRRLLPAEVRLIECERNTGFAGGNNIGILQGRGEYVLLLNNDAFPEPQTIGAGIRYLQNNPVVGVWAPSLVGADGRRQLSCARFPSILGLVGEYLFNINLDKYRHWSEWTTPHCVDLVIGAFFLTRERVIEKVGLLDEGFFFNVEDVDYCWRAAAAGFAVVYDPRVSAEHLRGASQEKKGWAYNTHLHENRIRYFYKHHGPVRGLLARIVINMGIVLRKLFPCWFRFHALWSSWLFKRIGLS